MKAIALVALGLAIAAVAAVLTRAVTAAAPLFAQPPDVPTVSDSAPSPQYAAAVERARELVRVAVLEQNLPGISLAVAAGLPSEALAKAGLPACCADGKAFYSTPSDLVRFAVATNAENVNGELGGGSVMSLVTRRDSGIVVAVTSNIAHADTAALALKVAGVFAEQK